MRRNFNIRKKRRILLQKMNQKGLKLLVLLILVLCICMIIYFFFIQNLFIKHNLEKESLRFSDFNENIPFSLGKIVLFSNATAETGSVNQQLSLDISQFCDIGIYLNNEDKENTILQSLYINDIVISSPELGTPFLYKKSINDLGKCTFHEDVKIENEFYFNIVDSNTELNYDNYELSNDSSTPIALGFYNQNVKKDFITDSSEIVYNGTLLKTAMIPQTSLKCNVSFSIHVITNMNEEYLCNVSFDIPFEDENGSIYDNGYINKEIKSNELSKFIRIK